MNHSMQIARIMTLGGLHSCAIAQKPRAFSQRRMGTLRRTTRGMLGILPIVIAGSLGTVHAATVPVSFEFDNLLFINGAPSPANPRVPTVLRGTGILSPFGAATLEAPGILTFGFSDSG